MTGSPASGDHVPSEYPLRLALRPLEGAVLVLEAAGEIDLLTAPLLSKAVTAALARRPRRLILDLTGVTFLDSAGLSVLIQAQIAAGENTVVGIVAPEDGVPMRTIALTGLREILAVFATRADALTAP